MTIRERARRNRPSRPAPRFSSVDIVWARGVPSRSCGDCACATLWAPRRIRWMDRRWSHITASTRKVTAPWAPAGPAAADHPARRGKVSTGHVGNACVKARVGSTVGVDPQTSIHTPHNSCTSTENRRWVRQTNKACVTWQKNRRRTGKIPEKIPLTCKNGIRPPP